MLSQFAAETNDTLNRSRETLTGVAVACCGPEDLMRSVMDAEADVDPALRKSVGGVEVFKEWVAYVFVIAEHSLTFMS